MRHRMVVWTAAAAMLVLVGTAHAVVEEAQLDSAGLKAKAEENLALARYLRHNGMPDAAEVRPIRDQPPWEDYEVTLYYFGIRKEIAFARARVLGHPEICTTRYERTLTDADIKALQTHLAGLGGPGVGGSAAAASGTDMAGTTCTGNATARAECAAGRAESAADRVELAAGRAEKAADRTEEIVAKMSTPAPATRHHKHSSQSKSAKSKSANQQVSDNR